MSQIISDAALIGTVYHIGGFFRYSPRSAFEGRGYVYHHLENMQMYEEFDLNAFIEETISKNELEKITHVFHERHPNFYVYNNEDAEELFYKEVEQLVSPLIPDSYATKRLIQAFDCSKKVNPFLNVALTIMIIVEIPFRALLHFFMKGVVSVWTDRNSAAYLKFKLTVNQNRPAALLAHKFYRFICG